MENKFVKINRQKMNILGVTLLTKHPWGIFDGNLCFTLDLIQMIIDVVMLGYKPYVFSELCHTSFKEFLQFKLKNKGAKWNESFFMSSQRPSILNHLKVCCHKNVIQIKNKMERTHLWWRRTKLW